MCGIVGARRFDGLPVEERVLRLMADRLVHRGPDGEGYWTSGGVGFGHRRLAIIDLAGSAQPMSSSEGTCHVCFNGEILNYRELRNQTPYRYRTSGDTEVLLSTFLRDGTASFERLRGQYAYALYDTRDGCLRLVRDRLGILPLYYYIDDRVIYFASEVKAILPVLPAAVGVDHSSLSDYLIGRSVPAPNTLFAGIRKIPPAHYLTVDPDGRSSLVRYWALPEQEDPITSQDEAVSAVADHLETAVAEAMVADVPVGAYLSGGVDSSLIVAMMARQGGAGRVETFSAGFGDPRIDELPWARKASQWLGTSHHEVAVSAADFEELWPILTWHRDGPLSEPADVAVFRLARAARERVKVVLSGEGSDELFAGYPKYRLARLVEGLRTVPDPVRKPAARALESVLPASGRRARVALRALGSSAPERYGSWFSPFSAEQRAKLLRAAPRAWQPEAVDTARGDVVRRMLHVDCHGWLSDNLLERGDRMSMAASLELRPPFLDHRLVELAFSLPTRLKVRGRVGKWIVKEVACRHLPADLVNRPKVGFAVPLDSWFRGALRDMARDRLLDPGAFVAEALDRRTIEGLLDRHDSGRSQEHLGIWTLLSLEVWHSVFFGQEGPAGPEARVESTPGFGYPRDPRR